MVSHLPRAALWVVVLLLLAGTVATIATAQAATPNYTLTGYAYQPGSSGGVPAGAQVDLVARATGAIYTTTVQTGGAFTFTTASTGGALAPGYWGVVLPPQGNVTPRYPATTPFAVLPVNQNPSYGYINATALTTTLYPTVVRNVAALSYNGTLTGIVKEGGAPVVGAQVQLLAPNWAGLVLVNNTTTSTGAYSFKVPFGTWVLKTTATGSSTRYSFLNVSVSSRATTYANVSVSNYLISGFVDQAANPNAPVPNGGNVTLWDGWNQYLYSSSTYPGGFYSSGSYPGNFTSGPQTFTVILSTVGYETTSYQHTVSSAAPYSRNVTASPLTAAERGIYNTTLNFSGINPASGKGTLNVVTAASLGNDTVFSNLPNQSVGQMWAQLGLDFHTGNPQTNFQLSQLPAFYAFQNASGPFFPAVQAGVSINSTTFLNAPLASGKLASESTTCAGSCGLGSTATIGLGWNQTFTLNGSLTVNSSQYSISFGFAHPLSSDTYNYSVVLPTGYALAAGTTAPANSKLVAAGPDHTWTKFTLVSQPSSSPSGTASFNIIRYSNMTANVNISVNNFAFSSSNILNGTHAGYTAVVGVGQNVTFSALNSTYPAGTNGTKFVWTFGDGGSPVTVYNNATTNHTYTVASGATPYNGTVTITSSGGLLNSTSFSVWAGVGPVTANISTNASASQNRTAGAQPYVFLNWGTVISFNASASTAKISPTAPVPGVLSVASYAFVAKGFKATYNLSAGQGQNFSSPYSYQFLGAGVYYANHTVINGVTVDFKGWQYNLTLTVWDGMGQRGVATLTVLVNDTQKPVSGFQVLNSAGKAVSGSGVVAANNLTAKVQFNGANATDPNNGSVTSYYWLVTNSGNASVHSGVNQTTVKPYPTLWLAPQQKAYTINLTVWDLNGNKGWTTQSLAVSVNSTTAPIMAANNLTAPTSYNSGSSYTLKVNITTGGGSQSTGQNVQVWFYLTSPSGTSRSYIAGTPGTVQFYNYTSGVVNTIPFATGVIPSMSYNTTVLAEITWSPTSTGNFVLYANVTASNEYSGDYINGPQVASQSITVNPNPTTQLLEYVAIAVAVVVVIVAIVFLYRRRTGRSTTTKTTSRSGLERGRSKSSSDDEDDDS
ncbi:MAG: hypothetical protein WA719_04565 [Thermoplasmata archaeon]